MNQKDSDNQNGEVSVEFSVGAWDDGGEKCSMNISRCRSHDGHVFPQLIGILKKALGGRLRVVSPS